jgi:hypothetical protein
MRTPRFLRIALPVAGALLVAAGAIAVTASAAGLKLSPVAATSSPSPKTSPSTAGPQASKANDVCQAYLGHLASHLKVSQSTLDQAATAAAKDTIKDQVAKGSITQAQADKLTAKLGSSSLCSAAVNGIGHKHKGGDQATAGLMQGYLSAAAAALGITEAQLRTDLHNGQSLSQIAATQKVSEADFKTKVAASLKPKLDAAVTAGKMTQAQEDAALAKFQQGDPPLWTSPKH